MGIHMNNNSNIGTLQQSRFLRCIAEPTRLQILALLAGEERCVGEIADALGKEQSLVSHHLARLRECNIVSSRQVAQKIYYFVADSRISRLVLSIQSLVASMPLCRAEAPCCQEPEGNNDYDE